MEIFGNKVRMRDKSTQFVNNEWVNNTTKITNSNAIPSKNSTTLVSNRQNINVVHEDGHSGDINNNNNNNNNNNLNYFYHILHEKFSTKTCKDLNIKQMNCLIPYILIFCVLSV